MFEKIKLWYIACSTGCSCCANENFDWGFYDNPEEPRETIDRWSRGNGNPLASQYAKYGRYHLIEAEAELLPDGRIIIDNTVFDGVWQGVIYW